MMADITLIVTNMDNASDSGCSLSSSSDSDSSRPTSPIPIETVQKDEAEFTICHASQRSSTSSGFSDAAEDEDDGVETPPPAPPSPEMCAKIVAQVEFYFSDVSITKDAFLLKHVKRSKGGFVSLRLIARFKKVKKLVSDWRTVQYAIKQSEQLELNSDCTKVRRKAPMPVYDPKSPSRTIVASNLPSTRPTIESVTEIFAPVGKIALVRIVRPGNPIPADIKNFSANHPFLGITPCALVEFTERTSVYDSIRLLDDNAGIRVTPLVNENRGFGASRDRSRSQADACANWRLRDETTTPLGQRRFSEPVKADQLPPPQRKRVDSQSRSSPHATSKARDCPVPVGNQQRKDSIGTSMSTPTGSPSSNSWLARRQAFVAATAAAATSATSAADSSAVTTMAQNKNKVQLIRMPKGPDGSKGFACGFRDRMRMSLSMQSPIPELSAC